MKWFYQTVQRLNIGPFLVKEEKILLLVVENNVEEEMVQTLINTVQTCTLSDIDVKKLFVYDFEWLWLNIRSKSIGETIQLKLKCPDDETQVVDYEFNVEDVKPDFSKKVNTHIFYKRLWCDNESTDRTRGSRQENYHRFIGQLDERLYCSNL